MAATGRSLPEVYEHDPDLAADWDEPDVVFASYRLKATPAAVLVTPEGTIASATVDGKLADRGVDPDRSLRSRRARPAACPRPRAHLSARTPNLIGCRSILRR